MPTNFIRKPNRLPVKELYNSNNSFFVTVCVEGRKCIFVETVTDGHFVVENGQKQDNNGDPRSPLQLNFLGKIIQQTWLNLPDYFENIVLDEFVIMPNHFHGIITFLDVPKSKFTGKESDLGKIIKRFKLESLRKIVETVTDGQNGNANSGDTIWRSEIASTTKDLIAKHNTIWQKSFYDHVIRNEKDLHKIREYIFNNPLQWDLDSLNPRNSG